MRKLIAWFVGIYIVLSAVTVWVILYFLEIPRPATVADWGELAKTVGVALTLIASLMAVVGTLINAHKQIKVLRDTEILRGTLQSGIEVLKGDIQRDVQSGIEVLKGDIQSETEVLKSSLQSGIEVLKGDIQRDVQSEIEVLKNSLQRQIEILKIITPLEISAYLELYSAAANYYRALAPLETGEWNANRAEKAEEMMVKAEATSVFIQADAHKVFWRDIWQDARIIVEKAKLYSNAEGWNQVWREEVYTFGQDLRRFEEAAKSASDRLIAPS